MRNIINRYTNFVEKVKGRDNFGLDSSGTGYGLVAISCEQNNKSSDFIKSGISGYLNGC
jgi:hypothetical protein